MVFWGCSHFGLDICFFGTFLSIIYPANSMPQGSRTDFGVVGLERCPALKRHTNKVRRSQRPRVTGCFVDMVLLGIRGVCDLGAMFPRFCCMLLQQAFFYVLSNIDAVTQCGRRLEALEASTLWRHNIDALEAFLFQSWISWGLFFEFPLGLGGYLGFCMVLSETPNFGLGLKTQPTITTLQYSDGHYEYQMLGDGELQKNQGDRNRNA